MPKDTRHIFHITINPIDYERRILNQAESAQEAGYQVEVIALGLPDHLSDYKNYPFSVRRLTTPFYRGGLFKFLHFNLKTFWFLLFKKIDIIHCHDLWVMPAAWVLRLLKKSSLIYDAHEYYAGLEIFTHNKIRKNIWMVIEYLSIPSVEVLITVSEPLASLYRQKYAKLNSVEVIRNLPMIESRVALKSTVIFPETENPVVLYQGHFRPGRGLINLIHALAQIQNFHLVLIGGGELENELRQLVKYYQLAGRVIFLGYVPTEDLIRTSARADLGIALFEPTSLNYAHALPNKFFEYIMAGLPVLASHIDTFKSYVDKYQVGLTVDPSDVQAIAAQIRLMFSDSEKIKLWRKNSRQAAKVLNWNKESIKMNAIYESVKN